MKKCLILFLTLFSLNTFSQSKINFEEYFVKNHAAQLIQSFNNTIDIDIPDSKANFSKNQASVVVQTFFKNNSPTSYKTNHRGGGNGRANYEIGNLTAGKLNYRTYLLYELKGEIVQIIELRIELED
ncbi:MAG: DUF4783 domain-containing protein [Flavobacteriales bacterium]|nr:DUF4783 domain-containing protein [Flavobacteriales bacterium]